MNTTSSAVPPRLSSVERFPDFSGQPRRISLETTVAVKGYGKNHGQIAKNGNWQEAWDIAFTDFLASLDQQLAASGQ